MKTATDEEAIFIAANNRPDRSERSAYLDEACAGDIALRHRVELLLSAYGEGQFLELPAAGIAATAELSPINEKPGAVIGSYKLLEQIGEGGMGLVFMAEQSQPLRRRVALKIIKPGLDTRAVIARFEAERQALALMDHPNIARVYDAGATDSGRPFFVMELVRGAPITDYCHERNLALRERVELFIEVCQAVQHAHQKGVIHRDLKPTNVLVSQSDTKPVPKVIDFGVAKATTQPLTDRTLFTAFSQIVGTPLYMSPEQADLGNQDVDTRSDVYSLGVVLYELLTGTTPFDAERLRSVSHDEMRRIIREEDPPKPSTRATTIAAATTAVAPVMDRRQISATALKGDLDWIVMKALDKDRRRRYESPSALAADMRRYLDDEPVEACPPSRKYRVSKFVRRNRVVLTTAALLGVTVLAGAVASVWQAVRATNAERRASSALSMAEDRLKIARQAVDQMYGQVAEKWLSQQGELTDIQREFLEKALNLYEGFAAERGDDPQATFDVARARHRVATIQEALGDSASAQASYQSAIKEFEEVPARFASGAGRRELGRALLALGNLHRKANRYKSAEPLLKHGTEILEELAVAQPKDRVVRDMLGRTRHSLGNVYMDLGRYEEAEGAYRRCRDIFEKLREETPNSITYISNMAHAQNGLGQIFALTGREGGAKKAFARATALREEVLALDPQNPEYRFNMVVHLINTSAINGWSNDAFAVNRHAMEMSQKLVDEFSDRPSYLEALVSSQTNVGFDLKYQGKTIESEELLRRAVASAEKLSAFPGNPDYRMLLSSSLSRLSEVLRKNDKQQEAEACSRRAIEINKELIAQYPKRVYYRKELAESLKWEAVYEYRDGDWRGAIEAAEGTIAARGDGGWSFQWLILALSHAKLGEMEQAHRWSAKAAHAIANGPQGDTPAWLVDEARAVFAAVGSDAQPETGAVNVAP